MQFSTKPNGLTRRRFLQALGAAAVGAPMIVPASALGRDGAVAPSNRIVMGVIGVGNRARAILPHFMDFKEIELRAACDCRADRLAAAKAMVDGFYGKTDCQTHHDFRELLARPDIDAVLIATGNRWHAMGSIYAAKAGKDVYSEKPISMTISEGRELVDVTRRLGTIYQAGHQRRSVDSYRFMAEAVKRGLIGRVHTVVHQVWEAKGIPHQKVEDVPAGFDYEMWLGQAPYKPFSWAHVNGWQYFWDTAEGVITDMGCHDTDIMQWALGMDETGPVEFEGEAVWPDPKLYASDTPLSGEVRFRYANGIQGVIRQKGLFAERYIRFIGDEGWIQLDDHTNEITAEPKSILALRGVMAKGWDDTRGHIGDWLRAIKDRTRTICHPEAAHRAISICQASNISLRLGRKLSWDPVAEKFIGDEEANRMLARATRAPWSA